MRKVGPSRASPATTVMMNRSGDAAGGLASLEAAGEGRGLTLPYFGILTQTCRPTGDVPLDLVFRLLWRQQYAF